MIEVAEDINIFTRVSDKIGLTDGAPSLNCPLTTTTLIGVGGAIYSNTGDLLPQLALKTSTAASNYVKQILLAVTVVITIVFLYMLAIFYIRELITGMTAVISVAVFFLILLIVGMSMPKLDSSIYDELLTTLKSREEKIVGDVYDAYVNGMNQSLVKCS